MRTAPKRRWLRFSLRRLAILIASACVYFACWTPTRTAGVDDVGRSYARKYYGHAAANASPVLPLLLKVTVHRNEPLADKLFMNTDFIAEQAYCVWFFGVVVEVPYSSRVIEREPWNQRLTRFRAMQTTVSANRD